MKKLMIVLLTLVLIVAGVFFWKGGHHALFLADRLEEWLEADAADQSITIQFQKPDFSEDDASGRIEPEVRQWSLSADGFWTEYGDRRVFGLSAGGVTAYLHEDIVYMDTGRAYALPEFSGVYDSLRELVLGLLVHGRVTKTEDTYQIAMKTDGLELSSSVTVDRELRAVTVTAVMPDGTAVHAALTAKETATHPIPQAVTEAMVRAKMERPVLLTEPLEVLVPAMTELLPLTADMKLGVECGILKLAEDVVLTVADGQAKLERQGIEIELPLPEGSSEMPPVAMGLVLLRNGEFERTDEGAVFTVTLPAETTSELCAALVPQIGELGVSFGESQIVLTIVGDELAAASMNAEGEVPFLITTIPVEFSAELNIR